MIKGGETRNFPSVPAANFRADCKDNEFFGGLPDIMVRKDDDDS